MDDPIGQDPQPKPVWGPPRPPDRVPYRRPITPAPRRTLLHRRVARYVRLVAAVCILVGLGAVGLGWKFGRPTRQANSPNTPSTTPNVVIATIATTAANNNTTTISPVVLDVSVEPTTTTIVLRPTATTTSTTVRTPVSPQPTTPQPTTSTTTSTSTSTSSSTSSSISTTTTTTSTTTPSTVTTPAPPTEREAAYLLSHLRVRPPAGWNYLGGRVTAQPGSGVANAALRLGWSQATTGVSVSLTIANINVIPTSSAHHLVRGHDATVTTSNGRVTLHWLESPGLGVSLSARGLSEADAVALANHLQSVADSDWRQLLQQATVVASPDWDNVLLQDW